MARAERRAGAAGRVAEGAVTPVAAYEARLSSGLRIVDKASLE